MWFRIEFDKSGSVISCTEGEASVKEGRHVVYVEATTKKEALPLAKRYFMRLEKGRARYASKRAAGVCAMCPFPAVEGKSLCHACAEKQREAVERRKAGFVRPKKVYESPAQAQQAFENQTSAAYRELRVLEEVMQAWNTERSDFGNWLRWRMRQVKARLPHKKIA